MIIQQPDFLNGRLLFLKRDDTNVYFTFDKNVEKNYDIMVGGIGPKVSFNKRLNDMFFRSNVLDSNNAGKIVFFSRPFSTVKGKVNTDKRNAYPTIEMFINLLKSMGLRNVDEQDGEGLRKSTGFKKSTRGKPEKSTGFKKSTRDKPEKTNKTKKKPVVQKGASVKTVPTHCQFGKTIILLNKLYQNNILSVKDSNNINIQGIPNSKVDDKFVNIILGICNNEEVNKKDIDTLSEKDFILFNVLIKKAGLTKKYNIDNTKAIKLLKDRLELVEGEILAGNTNEEIKKELYDIVFKLANLGATSLSNSRKYYKDVVKLMF
jgi:hypothetical protein